MAKKYLDENGLLYFWQKIKTKFALATHTHTKSQITDFPTSMTPTSHTHGNITNAGALQSTDVAIANGDKLVVTDSSNSNKIARTGTSFDGSTTTKALTQKGTFETFLQEHQDISGKVDKVSGKGLSTNDYTTAEKNKLAGIASGAEANVQADWDQTDTGADDYIKNKPTFTEDDHKWNDVELAHADFATDIGTESDYRGYIPVIGGVVGNTNPSLNATTSKMLKISTIAADVNTVVARDKNGYIWAQTPNSGDNTVRVATTAFVRSAVSAKVDSSSVGSANGVAPLDASGKVASTYLPSYVDDVIEAYPRSGATELSLSWLSTSSGGSALTPETGKIYVLMADSTSYAANTQFRWSGTTYVKLSDGGVSEITNSEIDTIVAS